MTLISSLRRFRAADDGVAATELSLLLPLFLALVAWIADTGIALGDSMRLDQGLRAGAQAALMNATDPAIVEEVALDSLGHASNGVLGGDGLCAPSQTCAEAIYECRCAGVTTTCNILCGTEPPEAYVVLSLEQRHESLLGPDKRVAGAITVRVR